MWHVMKAQEALNDGALLDVHRAQLAIWHLYRFPRPRVSPEALDAAFALLNEPPPYRLPKGAPTLSVEQDAALIVAAFRQLYGIDLPAECMQMDWRVFQALLSGITDGTRLGGVMEIRGRKLPKRTQHNGELIAEIQKAKSIYAITRKTGGQGFEDGLKSMVEILAAMCE